MINAYALPNPEDLWSDELQWLDSADIGDGSSIKPRAPRLWRSS
jgi:hypothetical protein